MKKGFLFLILSLLFIDIASSITTQITPPPVINLTGSNIAEFNETQISIGEEDFNHTFAGPEDYTFYIKIPQNASLTSAYLNTSGFYECLECGSCSYTPPGPDCTCPSPGSGGSCPGGCAGCDYTPSCPSCSCVSPYSGGGIESCYPCSYTPSCPDCSCTAPYSGGGIYRYSGTIYCTKYQESSGSAPTLNHPSCPSSGIGESATGCVCKLGVAQTAGATLACPSVNDLHWLFGAEACSYDILSANTKAFIQGYVGTYYCYSGTCSKLPGYCAPTMCTEYTTGIQSCSAGTCDSGYYGWGSCSPGGSSQASQTVGGGECYATTWSGAYCTGAPSTSGYCTSSHPGVYASSWGTVKVYSTVRATYSLSPSSVCSGVCASGWSLDYCSVPDCYSCHHCSYTPSPPCTCPSPGSGGGCKSCYGCSYTPPGPDCTCPSPGSGGSCPGGCSICQYVPPLPDCACTGSYTGGGCTDYGQPQSPWLDSTDDGTKEWSYSGWFNETAGPQKVDLNRTQINEWLSTCSPDSNGNCLLPIKTHSDYKGKMRFYSINLTFDFNISTIYTLEDNEGEYYWNQTSDVIAGEDYKRHYRAYTSNSPLPISASGYYLLNQTATDCWVNETHYTPTDSPLYCPISFSIERGSKIYHNISDIPLTIAVSKEEKSRIQDSSKTTFAGGNAYSVIPINVTNLDDTGETFSNIQVNLSTCPSGWTCDLSSWSVASLTESNWNETNATMYKYDVINYTETSTQTSFESRKRISWNLSSSWGNEDSIGYLWVNHTYDLPSDCQDVKVYINKTDYTDSPLVSVIDCQVNITWNSTIGPGEILDPEITYTIGAVSVTEGPYLPKTCSEWGVSGVHRCVVDCPDCYSEIGYKVRWEKSVTLENTGSVDEFNIIVKAGIPKATNSEADVKLYHPNNTLYPIDVISLTEGYMNYTVDRINSSETQTWTIKFNTTPPAINEYNETVETEWTKWFNITGGSDIEYDKVWSYSNLLEPLVHLHLYDNTTVWEEVTYSDEWGPPIPKDLDGNGYNDFYQWITPSILAGQIKKIIIKGVLGIVECEIVEKIIENPPVLAGENVEWKWTINCTNLVDVALTYSENIRLPLESTRIILNGNPIEPGFFVIPPYGPYITIEGSLSAYTSETHTLEFRTPPITIDVSPPRFPTRFWVGERARLILAITAKNWASEEVNETRTKINIVYGEDVVLYKGGFEIDREDLIKGYYILKVYNMSAYESRTYTLYYLTLTANAKIERYGRRVLDEDVALFYPVKVRALAPFPLDPLYIRMRHEDPFSCSFVKDIWLSNAEEYLNPPEMIENLTWECENDDTLINLKPLSGPGEEEFFVIFVTEQVKPPVPEIQKIIYQFFETIATTIKAFVSWLIEFFR